MGEIRMHFKVYGANGQAVDLDTGATFSKIPKSIATRLQILSYHNLMVYRLKIVNVMIDIAESKNFSKKIIAKIYRLISDIYPNFRDTIL